MKIRDINPAEKPLFWDEAINSLEKAGIFTAKDWTAASPEQKLSVPNMSRKIFNLINLEVSQAKTRYIWDGEEYFDDRLFILDLQKAKRGNREVWAVVTRWNKLGLHPYKVNEFEEEIEAIRFIKKIEPQTPRISFDGKSPTPCPSYIENLEIMKRNGEKSSYQFHLENKDTQRTLILENLNLK